MKVELLTHFGSDLMVVNVAKVSYNKESEEMGHKEERLLKFLAEHKHTTPFRHPQLQFRVECPIFVERQLFTHQIGWARNSISGRYVDFSDTYWLPDSLRMQSKNSKQGSDGYVPKEKSDYFISQMKEIVEKSADLYKEMSEYGVAKEQCRIHLPLALETKFIWTGSFHAFVHLCNLRLKPDAQQETRELVSEMLHAVKSIEGEPFKYSLLAFGL
jgi:thymidylate synthase (FAD)